MFARLPRGSSTSPPVEETPSGEAASEVRRRTKPQHPPDNNNNNNSNDDDEDDKVPPAPPLEPLFTLLTNTTTNTTIHPRVQYLFSDDDPSVLSAAPPADSRALVVDLAPEPDGAGWAVSWAASLSPDFAVAAARIVAPAPAPAAGAGVLRVDAVERELVELPPPLRSEGMLNSSADEGRGHDDVQALADEFRRRMSVLRKVVAEAERRSAATRMHEELLSSDQQQQQRRHVDASAADDDRPVAEGADRRAHEP
ncbi:hypothetical protein XA68_15028 [Ophiocordyceps unilateralis]|uniref:Uncharacterized protein n=1 Tax=Ophiocordyceps unilateralis TaxID=268505 RepID=A0A2A9P7I0_OPHUN|nr:hypothetical protein XA68_15028 [Ophiocordyceps unilateralis]